MWERGREKGTELGVGEEGRWKGERHRGEEKRFLLTEGGENRKQQIGRFDSIESEIYSIDNMKTN